MAIINRAITTYTAIGRYQVLEQTFFHEWHRETSLDLDPLAQTFSFKQDTFVLGVGLFFAVKDTESITVQLRDVVNGYPGPIAFASKTLQSTQVIALPTGPTPVSETQFIFDDPVLCNRDTQYCWVVMTEGTDYEIWVAKMGERDMLTNEFVPAQPFIGGTLFSSSDNRAWTAHQDMDAKFNLYTAQFDTTDAILNFNQLTGIEATQIIASVDQIVPSGASIRWEVSQNGTTGWIPLNINENTTKLGTKYANCFIRAVLSGNGMSPIINLGSVIATGIKFTITNKYINRNIVTLSSFTTIDIWLDVYNPAGTTFSVKFSTNDGGAWVNATQVGTQVIDSKFTQYHYRNVVSSSTQFRVMIDYTGTEVIGPEFKRLMVTLV